MLDKESERRRTLELGRRLRDGRGAKGWTLRRAAAETGISNGYLSLIEHGRVKEPSPTVLWALAEQYGIPYDELMALGGHPSERVTGRTAASPALLESQRHRIPVPSRRRPVSSIDRAEEGSEPVVRELRSPNWSHGGLGVIFGTGGELSDALWEDGGELPADEAGVRKDPKEQQDDGTDGGSDADPRSAARPRLPDERPTRGMAADDLTEPERNELLELALRDMRGFTAADIAQVRAFIAGIRAAGHR
jgi:transcriptional regulator with XRE-family HTH domain